MDKKYYLQSTRGRASMWGFIMKFNTENEQVHLNIVFAVVLLLQEYNGNNNNNWLIKISNVYISIHFWLI